MAGDGVAAAGTRPPKRRGRAWAVLFAVIVLVAAALWLRSAEGEPPSSFPLASSSSPRSPEVLTGPVQRPSLAAPGSERVEAGVSPDAAVAGSTADWVTVRGRCVAAEDGLPLGGCEVTVESRTSRTATDGRFEFRFPPTEFVTLRATAPDRATCTARWDRMPARFVEDLGDVRMQRGFRVSGRVVDGAGIGIPDIRCKVSGVETSAQAGLVHLSSADGTSIADGAFELDQPLLPGRHELLIVSARARCAPRAFDIDAVQGCPPLTIVVARNQHIAASVVDERGEPVDNVTFMTEHGGASDASDKQGVLDLWSSSEVAGTTRILLRDSFMDPSFVPPTVEWGNQSVRIVLRRGCALPILVVDEAGAPVEGFAVSIAHADSKASAFMVRERGQHAGGNLVIPDVHPGANQLRVLPIATDLMASEPLLVRVVGGVVEPVRVVLERLREFVVEVVDASGAPVGGSSVELVLPWNARSGRWLERWDPRTFGIWPRPRNAAYCMSELVASATTDAGGRASLLAPRDTSRLLLRVLGAHLPSFVDAPPLAPDQPLRVVVEQGAFLRGRVVLHGQAADRFNVVIDSQAGKRTGHGLSADGTFSSPLLSPGQYRVQVMRGMVWSAPGSGSVSTRQVPLPGVRDVLLRAGATTEVELDAPPVPLATVRGRVRFEGDGMAGSEWLVSLCRTDCDARLGAFAVAPDGSYAAPDVPPGRYRMALSRKGAGQAERLAQLGPVVEVLPGVDVQHDIQCELRQLILRLRNPDGSAVRDDLPYVWVRVAQVTFEVGVKLGEVVLEQASDLPVQVARDSEGPWSEPVVVPSDRRETAVDVIVPRVP